MSRIGTFYERFVFSPVLAMADRALSGARVELLEHARGRVLEIGIGSGLSLDYYGDGVEELVGLEPSTALLQQCRERLTVSSQAPNTELVASSAECMPWPDNSFDTVVAFLVFCTIPDPEAAAREMNRVLKPDGQLIFFEHVQAPEQRLARWQNRLNRCWQPLACGCNLNRDTRSVFERAGFDMSGIRTHHHPDIPLPLVRPVIEGVVGASKTA